LYLNPPYDDEIAEGRSQRMERVFLEHCIRWLRPGGVLVLVIPGNRVASCSDDLVKKFGERVRAVSLDVADESAAQAAVQVALDAFGRLDVVVNNAGFGDIAPFEQLSTERFKAVIDTNFCGVVNVTRAAVPHMRKQRSGCILQSSNLVPIFWARSRTPDKP
jgi:NAD(P)-dependent dehydrogenase (short-subunit alcohol dehydrogenase family)